MLTFHLACLVRTVSVPMEVTNYRQKFVGGLQTLRQVGWGSAMAGWTTRGVETHRHVRWTIACNNLLTHTFFFFALIFAPSIAFHPP